jgi:uncharacterized membrane-anchored protein
MRSVVAAVTCALALILVNVSIAQKERLLAQGRVVYLELAPVDPRSLMQGDYQALGYRIADDARSNGLISGDRASRANGRIVGALDARSIASFRRLDNGQLLAADEIALRYRVRGDQVKFATNGFFFQEGDAELYRTAKYGEFRVAEEGDLLLTGLRGPNLEPLGRPR